MVKNWEGLGWEGLVRRSYGGRIVIVTLMSRPWAPLGFALRIVTNLLYFCFCLFDANIELNAMDEEIFNDFHTEKWKWNLYVIWHI